MSIKFACSCGKAYKVPDKFSGKRIKCKKCGEPIRVPSESESGVQSQRAAAVSKRSVLNSQRVSSKSSRSKSGRSSAKLTSKRLAKTSSSSKSGRSSKRSKRAGSGTQRFTPLDLVEGNAIKRFQKKREEKEFARGEGRLTYFENGKPKKAFKVGRKGATVGRGDGCSVSVPSDSVSSKHLKLEYKLGVFIATDMQSTNGILVNGRSVRRASLKDGDVIQLGEAVLRIDCG
jgi:hypothetical protein